MRQAPVYLTTFKHTWNSNISIGVLYIVIYNYLSISFSVFLKDYMAVNFIRRYCKWNLKPFRENKYY